jgi:outer membrane murein-binding lipoprotein Lpp
MPTWLQIIIVASTLGGLLFAAFAMWLNFKEKQSQISTATSELGHTVAAQQQSLEAAERRIQNLEAIVTSQVWDAVHDAELPEAEKQRALSQAQLDLDVLEAEPSDAKRAAQIARRLKA